VRLTEKLSEEANRKWPMGLINCAMVSQASRGGCNCEFAAILRYISETVHHSDKVTTAHEYEVTCTLSNGAISNDLE